MTETEVLRCFRREADGSWLCVKPVQIGRVSINPGASFITNGRASPSEINVAEYLDSLLAKCTPGAAKSE